MSFDCIAFGNNGHVGRIVTIVKMRIARMKRSDVAHLPQDGGRFVRRWRKCVTPERTVTWLQDQAAKARLRVRRAVIHKDQSACTQNLSEFVAKPWAV